MMSRGGKFSGAYSICWDERAPLAEELMSSIERESDDDDDDGDNDVVSFATLRQDSEPPRSIESVEEDAPVSADRWDHAQLRLARSS